MEQPAAFQVCPSGSPLISQGRVTVSAAGPGRPGQPVSGFAASLGLEQKHSGGLDVFAVGQDLTVRGLMLKGYSP